ncbi:MAG TPA: FAD:protein FMN transferase [Candidatus Limnocylindrales bacterium]|nr:FAD:protein FMN transferase [Candidatus Limnocylindrales bacterium]
MTVSSQAEVVRFEGRALGSPLRLMVHGVDRGRSAWLWDGVLAEFEAVDASLSRFRDDSEITRLNRSAGSDQAMLVSRRLSGALVAADRARRMTAGRFDPTVLADLDRLGYRGASVSQVAGHATPSRRPITWCADGIRLSDAIDLGGIGKGLALRWAAARIARGCPHAAFLLEAGGDIVACGRAPEGGPWLIGIEDPAGTSGPVVVAAIDNGAVATSSVRITRWRSDGRDVHHLIDPATREPADGGLQAVTVAHRDPAWAEVWSKALFVAGRASIAALARERGLAAWWAPTDGTTDMTPAARQITTWVAAET